MGGGAARFPETRLSEIFAASSGDSAARRLAWDSLLNAYWKPVYKHLRLRWNCSNEEAKDWTQEFFATAFEKDYLPNFDPARASFRGYLKMCLDRFSSKQRQAEGREKRGGGVAHLPLDFEGAEAELALSVFPDEEPFETEWLAGLFQAALASLEADLKSKGRAHVWQIFRAFDLPEDEGSRPGYRELAQRFGIQESGVTNGLAAARRQMRRLLLDQLRAITASEAEYRREAQVLFGVRNP